MTVVQYLLEEAGFLWFAGFLSISRIPVGGNKTIQFAIDGQVRLVRFPTDNFRLFPANGSGKRKFILPWSTNDKWSSTIAVSANALGSS
jgi:hypothetical protein